MECPNKVESTKVNCHGSTETGNKIFLNEPTVLPSTPEKRSTSEWGELDQDQRVSPILESTFFTNKNVKNIHASTPASVCPSADSPEHGSDSVINILDRLCSPILDKFSSRYDSGRSKDINDPFLHKVCPANKSNCVEPNLQKRGKRLFCDTEESKSVSYQHVKKVKHESNYGKEISKEREANCRNNDLFKQHDVSENTLQVICDMTEHIVDHDSSDHNKSDKSVTQLQDSVQSCRNGKLQHREENSRSEGDSDSKLPTQIDFDNNTLIYSATNLEMKAIKLIKMNDLFLGVKVLEEGNKPHKQYQTKTHQTATKYSSVGESNPNDWYIKKSGNEYNPDINVMKKQVLGFEPNNSLNSLSISDTQFCEAIEAAEMVTDLDLTLNKFSLEHSDSNNKPLKENKESFEHIYKSSADARVPTDQDLKRNSDSLENLVCDESCNIESSKRKCTDRENNEKYCITLSKNRCNETKALLTVQQCLKETKMLNRFQTNNTAVEILQKPKERAVHVNKDKQQPYIKCFKTPCGGIVRGDEESVEQAAEMFDREDHNILGVQNSKVAIKKQNQLTVPPLQKTTKQTTKLDDLICETQTTKENIIQARELFENTTKTIIEKKDFQTACGKNVPISDESLRKARGLFKDGLESTTGMKGFQTPSGKSVQISEESLRKARGLFEDGIETTTGMKGFLTSSGKSVAKGFQTSNGKWVQISEESLSKSRGLFEDGIESTTGMKGFQTASGKSVQISEESLSKARGLFEDGIEITTGIKGFQTACGKSVQISEESLSKARGLFEDGIEIATGMKGFQTASGKIVPISEESLSKARGLFENGIETTTVMKGFQTASGKIVPISEESLKKAREVFEDGIESTTGMKGFQTASGKSVQISEESLSKARGLFEDGIETTTGMKGFQTACGKSVQISEESLSKARGLFEDGIETTTGMKGFQTASGKIVKISEESLNKVRNLFEYAIETIPEIKGFITANGKTVRISEEPLNKAINLFQDVTKTAKEIKGFQTASGKSVQISEESMSKARGLFEDEIETTTGMKGFQTASGKIVPISEESLKKARDVFEDGIESTTGMKGFQTACGKSVQISEESFSKARGLFEDGVKTITGMKGFQTASGKIVSISEESLKKARDVFEDGIESTTGMKGFQTASGKSVTISEESLNKARGLFDDGIATCIGYKGFKTATGKHVEVSNEALTKSSDFSVHFSKLESETNSEGTLNDVSFSVKSEYLNKLDIKPIHKSNTVNNGFVSSPFLKGVDREERHTNVLDKSEQIARNEDNHPLPSPDRTSNFKTPKIQRKLFFSPCNSDQKSNNIDRSLMKMNSSSNTCLSVISDDDLSLLNQSLTILRSELSLTRTPHDDENRSSKVLEKACVLTPEVAQEVSDSMAALMADEASTSPFCKSLLLKPMLTCPSMMFDRDIKFPSIHCDDKESHLDDKPLSPVLDAYSGFKPKQFLKKRKLDFYENEGNNQHDSTPTSKAGSFKPPYATSTPIETVSKTKVKRKWQGTEHLTPDLKRIKPDAELEPSTKFEANMDKVIQARIKAAERQEQIIKDKMSSNTAIKPCKGSYLLRTQTERRKALKDLSGDKPFKTYSSEQLLRLGVKKSVIDLAAGNAVNFRFSAVDHYSEETVTSNVEGLPVGDGAMLILDPAGEAGVAELSRSFLSSPAVAPRLLPDGWVLNHLRWILLKLAATQRRFPHLRLVTPNNVMLQLKYRYDREIDRCERPALRKVLEKDESPAKAMLLFVADIHSIENGEKKALELELSDGWYSVRTCIDHEMELLVRRGVVSTGTKLLTQGAELINCTDGCHPLEATPEVRLRIWSNSTRRARWFARLGFSLANLPPLRLRGVLGRGGAIQALTATVSRSYPLLYREKSRDGKIVVRGEKAEETAVELYQQQRQQCAENILTRLQADLPADPEELMDEDSSKISEQIEEKAMKMQQFIEDKLLKELDEKIPPRVVSRMLKMRLSDSESRDDRSALLTLWNPSDQVLRLFSEGSPLVFHNLSATGYSRYGEVQLSAGRQTRYSLQSLAAKFCAHTTRVNTSLASLRPNFKALFSEIDVVGLVLPLEFDNPNTVYIADDNYNFLCISFWINLKGTGFLSMLGPGRVVAVSNLRWHAHLVSWNLPSAYATEVTSVSQHPRQPHLRPVVSDLLLRLEALDLARYMEECVKRIRSLIVQRDSGGMTPRSRAVDSLGSLREQLTLVDNQQDVETPTGRRIAWLEKFGDPPPLSPLVLNTPVRSRRSFCRPAKNKSSTTSDDR